MCKVMLMKNCRSFPPSVLETQINELFDNSGPMISKISQRVPKFRLTCHPDERLCPTISGQLVQGLDEVVGRRAALSGAGRGEPVQTRHHSRPHFR